MVTCLLLFFFFFFSSRRRHTRFDCDWSSDVCSSDLACQPESAQASRAAARLRGYQGSGAHDVRDAAGGTLRQGGQQLLARSEEHTSELQSQSNLVCRLLLEKKKTHSQRLCSYSHTSAAPT